MQDAARPGKLRWAALLALHTIIFVIGYTIAIRVVWGVAVILIRSGIKVDLATILSSHGLWTALAAGFVVGLIGVTGIETVFGRISTLQSFIDQPSVYVCAVFAVWFVFGALKWMVPMWSQQSVLVESRWLADFAETFFLADCPPGWLIHQINFDSCTNQLAYTTLFVASLGYAASRLVGMIGIHRVGSAVAATANSAEEK